MFFSFSLFNMFGLCIRITMPGLNERRRKKKKYNNGNINYISDIVKFVLLNASHLTNKHKTISRATFLPAHSIVIGLWVLVQSFHLSILGFAIVFAMEFRFSLSLSLFVLVVSFVFHLPFYRPKRFPKKFQVYQRTK